MRKAKYVVFGALGLVGRAVVEALEREGTEVIGVARRPPDFETQARFFSLDLMDQSACVRTLADPVFRNVTHIVYAALFEKSDLIAGWRDEQQIEINTRMLTNVLDHLQPSVHLTLMQGTKAYGAHIQAMLLPGKEHMPRHPGRNFYWSQEDLVIERAAANGWNYSVLRPQIVCGVSLGSPMNMVLAVGVYISVMKALAQPCGFPGRPGFVTEATDAGLLARAILWAGRSPECAGQTFNITNGDILHWPSLWPALTALFDVAPGEPVHRSLAEQMPQHAPVWDRLVAEHDLQPRSMDTIIGQSWQFADAVFGYAGAATTLLSTIKARQFGFAECLDTEIMFGEQIQRLQQLRVLPR